MFWISLPGLGAVSVESGSPAGITIVLFMSAGSYALMLETTL